MKNQTNILISFIIPVYNVEMYLEKCVDHIISQKKECIEVILVDDGSTDDSGEICDKLALADSRIHVVHKLNGGLASARNKGLEFVRGRYVAFVDSDDYIADNCLDSILEWIDKGGTDICFMNATKFYPNGYMESLGDCISRNEILNKSKRDVIKYLSERPKYPGSACTKIYRYDFLEENNLHFPIDCRLSEDLGFVRDCILQAKTYDVLEIPYYFYRQNRKGSITNVVSNKTIEGLLMFICESVELLTDENKPKDKECEYAMSFVAYEYSILLYNYSRMQDETDIWDLIEKNAWVLDYGRTPKIKIINWIRRILGLKLTAMFIRIIKR